MSHCTRAKRVILIRESPLASPADLHLLIIIIAIIIDLQVHSKSTNQHITLISTLITILRIDTRDIIHDRDQEGS